MLRAEGLEGVSPDQDTFSEQLLSCRDSAEDGRAVAFPNLRGDAQLVAPWCALWGGRVTPATLHPCLGHANALRAARPQQGF